MCRLVKFAVLSSSRWRSATLAKCWGISAAAHALESVGNSLDKLPPVPQFLAFCEHVLGMGCVCGSSPRAPRALDDVGYRARRDGVDERDNCKCCN